MQNWFYVIHQYLYKMVVDIIYIIYDIFPNIMFNIHTIIYFSRIFIVKSISNTNFHAISSHPTESPICHQTGFFFHVNNSTYTPPKTNMEPEKDGFQKESPFAGVHFQVPCWFSGV